MGSKSHQVLLNAVGLRRFSASKVEEAASLRQLRAVAVQEPEILDMSLVNPPPLQTPQYQQQQPAFTDLTYIYQQNNIPSSGAL